MMENRFQEVLKGKKIAPLTLDRQWMMIFGVVKPTRKIKALHKELDGLIKRQGKLTTESKDIRKIKSRLMGEIMQNMESIGENSQDEKTKKKLENNRRLINECNEKLTAYEDELLEMPAKIDQVNKALMLETMEICYSEMKENESVIEQLTAWIGNMREELKKQILKKQDHEEKNEKIYQYLHGVFGPDVIDLFDIRYDYEKNHKGTGG